MAAKISARFTHERIAENFPPDFARTAAVPGCVLFADVSGVPVDRKPGTR